MWITPAILSTVIFRWNLDATLRFLWVSRIFCCPSSQSCSLYTWFQLHMTYLKYIPSIVIKVIYTLYTTLYCLPFLFSFFFLFSSLAASFSPFFFFLISCLAFLMASSSSVRSMKPEVALPVGFLFTVDTRNDGLGPSKKSSNLASSSLNFLTYFVWNFMHEVH